MKLYHSDGVWQLPGQQDKGATKVEVPTGSADLCGFLNDRNVPAFPVFESETVASGLTTPEKIEAQTAEVEAKWDRGLTQPTEAAIAAKVSQFKTDEIVEFILDHASVNQCANILSSLGTRFGEHAKESRR